MNLPNISSPSTEHLNGCNIKENQQKPEKEQEVK